jgi:hypothetical protein
VCFQEDEMTTGRKNLSYFYKSCSDLLQDGLGDSRLVATVTGGEIQLKHSKKKSAPLMGSRLGTVKVKAQPDLSLNSSIVSAEMRFKTIPFGNFCELRMHHA